MSFLEVSELVRRGRRDDALKGISFSIPRFRKLAIAGETGSGKSTLLKIIAGLVQPDGGYVIVDGERVLGPAEKLVPGHPSVAYLSQHFELPHSLRVEQTLGYANTLSDENAKIIFDVCRIDHLLPRRTDELSGGERQRIAIARLLVGAPKLLLLDEPYSNLDMSRKTTLKSVIEDVGHQLGISCILVSHDPADTLPWADEVMVMRSGEIVQSGDPRSVYFNPVNSYAAGLFGYYSTVDTKTVKSVSAYVRPERFSLTDEKGLYEGSVIRSLFFGDHWLIEANVKSQIFYIRNSAEIAEGKLVRFNII